MENNLNYSSEVRKKILSMLMFQLYSDERTIYREYVQNALDSINKAIDTRVLNQAKDGVVNIDIDVKHKVIELKIMAPVLNLQMRYARCLIFLHQTKTV